MSPSPRAGEGQAARSAARERGRRLSKLRGYARSMRSTPTDAEHRLWQLLRGHRFSGHKFRRQVPIEPYVADFVCFDRRLIVELDGGQHAESRYDTQRDDFLRSQGFQLLRFWNSDLFDNEEGVLTRIAEALSAPPLPNPSPARGEGLNGACNGG